MTFETQKYNIILGFKSEVIRLPNKKMGRPTDNPKTTQFSVRFDSETLEILDDYCKRKNCSRPQGIRIAVKKLKEE